MTLTAGDRGPGRGWLDELYEGAEAVRLLVTVPPAAARAVPELLKELAGGQQ